MMRNSGPEIENAACVEPQPTSTGRLPEVSPDELSSVLGQERGSQAGVGFEIAVPLDGPEIDALLKGRELPPVDMDRQAEHRKIATGNTTVAEEGLIKRCGPFISTVRQSHLRTVG